MKSFVLIVCFVLAGCSDSTITSPEQIVFPEKNVSYQQHVNPLLTLTCSYSGCHDSDTKAGNVDVSTYFSLTSRAGLIIPGKPDMSLLNQVLEGKITHFISFQSRLNSAQIKGIRTWVSEGALNN